MWKRNFEEILLAKDVPPYKTGLQPNIKYRCLEISEIDTQILTDFSTVQSIDNFYSQI